MPASLLQNKEEAPVVQAQVVVMEVTAEQDESSSTVIIQQAKEVEKKAEIITQVNNKQVTVSLGRASEEELKQLIRQVAGSTSQPVTVRNSEGVLISFS